MHKEFTLDNFDLGTSIQSGHEVFPDAELKYLEPLGESIKYILKKNKHGRASASELEVAFSHVTQLFLGPGLTPSQNIVVDDTGAIWGLAVEHMCYVVDKNEGRDAAYYKLKDPALGCDIEEADSTIAEQIPIQFFDELPHEYFSKLIKPDSGLTIDYASLANIMATSYFLEEDDLHKGNFGFYIIKKDDKPLVRFFKIDHDLMFIDSIMSFCSVKFFHWGDDEYAFDITAQDLLDFPDLKDSSNRYWPTKKSILYHPWQDKEYRTYAEVEAFASLGQVEEFNKAKWLAFYKHILVPIESIKKSLAEGLDENDPIERAQLAMVLQAAVARQSRLRAVLFSVKQFRDFVRDLSADAKDSLVDEVVLTHPEAKAEVQTTMQRYDACSFEEGDTPLHVAIKLGDYRGDETLYTFKSYIDKANSSGLRPLDIALEQAKNQAKPADDIRQDGRYTLWHLLKKRATETQGYKDSQLDVSSYQFQTPYLNRAKGVQNYEELKDLLRDIGEDYQYCLKAKKNLAIECIDECIRANPAQLRSMLTQLKKDVNAHEEESGGLAYIRQLRSSLWIVRQIRGLYGWSSTLMDINCRIDKAVSSMQVNELCNVGFFSSKKDAGGDVEESEPSLDNPMR